MRNLPWAREISLESMGVAASRRKTTIPVSTFVSPFVSTFSVCEYTLADYSDVL